MTEESVDVSTAPCSEEFKVDGLVIASEQYGQSIRTILTLVCVNICQCKQLIVLFTLKDLLGKNNKDTFVTILFYDFYYKFNVTVMLLGGRWFFPCSSFSVPFSIFFAVLYL